jgi:BlaI family penicillinase repressor
MATNVALYSVTKEIMVSQPLPDLSRFELQCLSKLWERGQASVRDVHGDLQDPPSYSTVRKIFERLEEKGAVERVGQEGKALVFRSLVPAGAMIQKEIQRFLDTMFSGAATPLVSHLAQMEAVSLEDLKALEKLLGTKEQDS